MTKAGIVELIIDGLENLEAAVHNLARFHEKEVFGGVGSSIIQVGHGEKGYVQSTTTVVDLVVDHHLHAIKKTLEDLTTKTTDLADDKEGKKTTKEERIKDHLIEKAKRVLRHPNIRIQPGQKTEKTDINGIDIRLGNIVQVYIKGSAEELVAYDKGKIIEKQGVYYIKYSNRDVLLYDKIVEVIGG